MLSNECLLCTYLNPLSETDGALTILVNCVPYNRSKNYYLLRNRYYYNDEIFDTLFVDIEDCSIYNGFRCSITI